MKNILIFIQLLGLLAVLQSAQISLKTADLNATLQQIYQEVEKFKQDTLTITLEKGRHFLKKGINLQNFAAKMVIQGEASGETILDGGVFAPPTLIQKVPWHVQEADSVFKIDLKRLSEWRTGTSERLDFGELKMRGFWRPHSNSAMELFVNGNPMKLARWPNEGFVPLGKILDKGATPRNGNCAKQGGKFQFDHERLQAWVDEEEVWLEGYFNLGYANDALKVKEIDLQEKSLLTEHPHVYGFRSGKKWTRWFAYNLRSELDTHLEYFVSRRDSAVYFQYSGQIRNVQLSMLEEPMISIQSQKNIEIKNITFENTRGIGIYSDNSENIRIDSSIFRNIGQVAIVFGKGIEPFVNPCDNADAEVLPKQIGSLRRWIYDNQTYNPEGGKNNVLSNLKIYNTGSGGVILAGGDRITLEKGGSRIEHSEFYNTNRREKSYRPAVHLIGVGQTISHSSFTDLPGMAVYLNGNDHIIELSKFTRVSQEIDDLGAVYYGRNPSERGHIVRYNHFEDLNDHFRCSAVYHDDGAGGMDVYGNYFVNAGSKTILIGGGSGIRYWDNVFLNNKQAVEIDRRLAGWAKGFYKKNGLYQKRLEEVYYQEAPYAERYPMLVNYMDGRFRRPRQNSMRNNVFINSQKILRGKKQDIGYADNWELDALPDQLRFIEEPNSGTADSLVQFKQLQLVHPRFIGVRY